MKSYVYKIENLLNSKIYIGKTNKPHKRWLDHLTIARNKNIGDASFGAIHSAIKKYGQENFIFSIVEEFDSEDVALDKETEIIKTLKLEGKTLYNLTDGGEGVSGYKHTEETKKLFSLQRKGRPVLENARKLISLFHTGRVKSEEELKNISLGKKGKPCPEGTRSANTLNFIGEKSNSAILKELQVIEIINLIKEKLYTSKEIGNMFGVSEGTIADIKTNRTWKYLPRN